MLGMVKMMYMCVFVIDVLIVGCFLMFGFVVDCVFEVVLFQNDVVEGVFDIGVCWLLEYILGVVCCNGGFVVIIDFGWLFNGVDVLLLVVGLQVKLV